MAKITPMMEQYFKIKEKCKDALLFFRLGDFYEMFFNDAKIASRELDLTLTGRDWGQEERAPMCGVPYHSVDGYISRLIEKGYKVAICEQTENPKDAKGLVKREIVRMITPGTIIDNAALDEKKNNFIMCVYADKNGFGLSVCDVTTGELMTSQFVSAGAIQGLVSEIARFRPAEIICNDTFENHNSFAKIEKKFGIHFSKCDTWMFDYINSADRLKTHFKVHNLDGYGLKDKNHAVCACGALIAYLRENQKNDLSHIFRIKYFDSGSYMIIDPASRRNLELTESMGEKSKKGSLLWVLDKTKTAMGARLLRNWVGEPLKHPGEIAKRLDAVEELKNDLLLREEIKEVLGTVHDFERLMSKVIYQTANARDLAALKNSTENLPQLKKLLSRCKSAYLKEICAELDVLSDVYHLIESSIPADPPFTLREGGIIKEGFDSELDILLGAKKDGAKWLSKLEDREKKETGIKNLKVRYNKVFGYYIEVTKSNISDVPERYVRKQTLANCERYITEELNGLAELILSSDEKAVVLEYEIFVNIRNSIAGEIKRIQYTAYLTAITDVLQALAEVAGKENFTKPMVDDSDIIEIQNGRHPVVEKMSGEDFIPNDTYLDTEESRLLIITGPNMAGKSTYMRQTALIVIMAQIGSFVPASYARIGAVDRVFTRIGAADDLSAGQSTFMTEMVEVANILNNATNKSLLILDEIGRGTSTFDGLSIAWAVLEYITDKKQVGAKSLFATHYHELTELEGKLPGVKNYSITVAEDGEDVIFLRKIVRGGADRSYGIQVARLAGLPQKVILRSGQILKQLNSASIAKNTKKIASQSREKIEEIKQVDIFSVKETGILEELNKIDVMSLTPIEAIQRLFELQKKARGL